MRPNKRADCAGESSSRTYRIYQGITGVLLVTVFLMALLFVGLVAVNTSGAGPPATTEVGAVFCSRPSEGFAP